MELNKNGKKPKLPSKASSFVIIMDATMKEEKNSTSSNILQ
jgi:hypothetical protein